MAYLHALTPFFTFHSSPLSGVYELSRMRTIMYDIKCLQIFCHPFLAIALPVLPCFTRWELRAGATPPAFLRGDSWLWVREG